MPKECEGEKREARSEFSGRSAAALFEGFPHETRQRRAERALLPRCHPVRSAWPPCLWPAQLRRRTAL